MSALWHRALIAHDLAALAWRAGRGSRRALARAERASADFGAVIAAMDDRAVAAWWRKLLGCKGIKRA